MERGNGVGAPRDFQAQHGHAEFFVVVGRVFASKRHQLVVREPQKFSQRSQMFFDQVRAEPVVSRRHRRVGGKNDFARNAMNGLVESQAFLLHTIANSFEYRKSAVSLIKVKNAWCNAHRFQRAESPDSKQQLLSNANPAISAVETRGQLAIFRSISFDVGID